VGVEDEGDGRGELLGGGEVEELVGAVGVGVRAEDAGQQELGVREAAASIPMNGIDPPSPRLRAGWPNVASLAARMASASQSAVAGQACRRPSSPS
jgi:hypothetical protein